MPVINELPQSGGKWELIWTNPNPTSAINSPITVRHDMTPYEYVFVSIAVSTTHTANPWLVQARRDSSWIAVHVEGNGTGYNWMSYRWFTWNPTQFSIGADAGYVYHGGGSTSGGTYAVPLAVYGVKRLNLG